MAYSTGSGAYTDLMAAVLAHAIADGWTTNGGNWPISKGRIRGVDWDTFTADYTDYTNSAAVPHTARWIRIAIGSSHANATANLGDSAAHFPNMEYNIDQWHIFSDPASGNDYIHVVYQFSNGVDQKVFGHFSFGEVDRHGMTHGGVAYASGHPCRGFNPTNTSQRNSATDANAGNYARVQRIFTGRLGWSWSDYFVRNSTCYMISPTDPVFPDLPTWPQADILYDHARLLDTYGPTSTSFAPNDGDWRSQNAKMNAQVMYATSHPYSGGISLGPLPMLIANTTSQSSTLQFVTPGSFPNVRVCNLSSFLEGDEVTYGSDTWMLFPMLCKKPRSTLGEQYVVSSGEFGFAYKKVV